MDTLVCSKCGIAKPDAEFSRSKIHPNRRFRYPSCKACCKAKNAEWFQRNKDEILARRKADKDADPEKHREWRRKGYQRNKAKIYAVQKAWRAANKPKLAAYQRGHRQRHPQWYVAFEKRRAPHKRVVSRRWRHKNTERVRMYVLIGGNKYRAKKRAARVGTDRKAYIAFVRQIRLAAAVPCYWCGRPTRKGKRHIDHIIPLSKGGADCVHNLCCSCPSCNSSKKDKPPEVFSGQFELVFSLSPSASRPSSAPVAPA